LAQKLREQALRIAVDLSNKKIGDQISNTSKRGITKVLCIGDEEVKNGKLRVKDLVTGDETVVQDEIVLAKLLEKTGAI
jgi:histidyl-tRNA synthetase